MGQPSPTVITPPPPTVYQSVQPLRSYKMAGDFLNRLQRQTNTAQEQLYTQAGTPGEIGARQAGTRLQAAGSYLSSLPTEDVYTRANLVGSAPSEPAASAEPTPYTSMYSAEPTPYTSMYSGESDQYAPAAEAGQAVYSAAQQDYADALSSATKAPPPAYNDRMRNTPSWAEKTIPEGRPGYNPYKKNKQGSGGRRDRNDKERPPFPPSSLSS